MVDANAFQGIRLCCPSPGQPFVAVADDLPRALFGNSSNQFKPKEVKSSQQPDDILPHGNAEPIFDEAVAESHVEPFSVEECRKSFESWTHYTRDNPCAAPNRWAHEMYLQQLAKFLKDDHQQHRLECINEMRKATTSMGKPPTSVWRAFGWQT